MDGKKWMIGTVIGVVLIIIPDITTTGAGILITLGSLGFKAADMTGVVS